jgi:hypothetical protein
MDLIRGVDPLMQAAMAGPFFPICLAYLDWPGAPVYAHSGVGTITWDGHDWIGVGTLGNIDIPPETAGVAAVDAMLSLAGLSEEIEMYVDDPIRNRTVELYLGVVAARPGEPGGNQLRGDPVSLFGGTMDGLSLIASQGEKGVTTEAQVNVATGPSARSSATIYHTDENQKSRHPLDTAGRLVILAYARAQKLTWPET